MGVVYHKGKNYVNVKQPFLIRYILLLIYTYTYHTTAVYVTYAYVYVYPRQKYMTGKIEHITYMNNIDITN